jgi:hypothetical protein
VRVDDVLELQRRAVAVDPSAVYEEIGVRSFGRGIFHKEPVSGADLGAKRVFRIQSGDLVISNVFAWEGAIAVAMEAEDGKIGSHRFMTFTPTDDRINTSWAAWYFRSEQGLDLIRKASPGSAGRNRTLAIDRFGTLEIPLPAIGEQHQQARYLNNAAGWAAAVAWRFTHQSADSLVALLPGLVDEITQSKSVGASSVRELAEFVSDTVHPGDNPAPAESFIGLQHIERHTGRRLGSDPIGAIAMKGRKFRFRPGDVLYGYLRPYLNKVWVADRHGLCSVDQYVLRPRTGVSADLLAHSLRGRDVLTRAIELTHNLQLPRLRSGLVASLILPTVAEADVTRLVAQLDEVRDRVVAVTTKRGYQEDLTAAIVPSAMNQAFACLS